MLPSRQSWPSDVETNLLVVAVNISLNQDELFHEVWRFLTRVISLEPYQMNV